MPSPSVSRWVEWPPQRRSLAEMPSQLFSHFRMRDLEQVNRIVVSPMANTPRRTASATDWHTMHLGHLSASGAGFLITEATAVEEAGRLS
jgi:2,4-dienoyl-CoA reductase-like NADH-dependent reductase (Old Yellow Enzyme family)